MGNSELCKITTSHTVDSIANWNGKTWPYVTVSVAFRHHDKPSTKWIHYEGTEVDVRYPVTQGDCSKQWRYFKQCVDDKDSVRDARYTEEFTTLFCAHQRYGKWRAIQATYRVPTSKLSGYCGLEQRLLFRRNGNRPLNADDHLRLSIARLTELHEVTK